MIGHRDSFNKRKIMRLPRLAQNRVMAWPEMIFLLPVRPHFC